MRRALPLLFLVACSSSSSSSAKPVCDGTPPDQLEACLTSAYFQGFDAEPFGACPGFVTTSEKVSARREISLFRSAYITDDDVATEGRFLQRFYQPYELTFFTTRASQVVAFPYALAGTNAELANATAQAGIKSGATPTPEQRAKLDQLVSDILFRDLRAFVAQTSAPPVPEKVDVVILEQIASPDVAAELSSNGTIAGLGLSPVLFRNIAADDPNRDLFTALALPQDFTPTLFVGHRDVVRLARNAEVVVAHELGHSMGLQHTQESGNLMTQYGGDKACLPGLTDTQVGALRNVASVLPVDGWQVLLDAKRTVVDRLVARASR